MRVATLAVWFASGRRWAAIILARFLVDHVSKIFLLFTNCINLNLRRLVLSSRRDDVAHSPMFASRAAATTRRR